MKKKMLILVGVLAIVALGFWRVVYFPYDRELLYRAIPQDAAFISEHQKLGERWETLAENPFTKSLLVSLGVKPEQVEKTVKDPGIELLLSKFAKDNTIVAYAPSYGRSGRPAWVLASWAGMHGQFARWGWYSSALTGFSPLHLDGGRGGWYMPLDEGGDGRILSLAVADGVLLACVSEDTDGVKYLIDRVERRSQMSKALENRMLVEQAADGIMDRGWYRTGIRNGSHQPVLLGYSLSEHSASRTAGRIEVNTGIPAGALTNSADADSLAKLLGANASAVVMVPYSYMDKLLLAESGPDWLKMAGRGLKAAALEDGTSFACLLKDEYSSKIMMVKVPGFLVGTKIKDKDLSLAVVAGMIERMNVKYRWSFSPRKEEINGTTVMVLDGTAGGISALLKTEDHYAIFVYDGWLVFSSGFDSAKKLLSAGKEGTAPWRSGYDVRKSSAYAWVDLAAANQAMKTLHSLSLLLNSGGGGSMKDSLAAGRSWIDSMRTLGACNLWLDQNPKGAVLDFQFGTNGPVKVAP